MFVVKGAKEMLRIRRKNEFYDNYIVNEGECYLNPSCVEALEDNKRISISEETKNSLMGDKGQKLLLQQLYFSLIPCYKNQIQLFCLFLY